MTNHDMSVAVALRRSQELEQMILFKIGNSTP
jgi:hypothetical protein